MKAVLAIFLLSLSVSLAAQHSHHNNQHHDNTNIVIHNPTLKVTPPGITNSAGYFHIMNHSDNDITLVDAKSDIAVLTEIHEHIMNNGIMKMQKVNSLTIPANSTISFEPGGYHIMFINLHKPIVENQQVKLTLVFSDGTEKSLIATAVHQVSKQNKHMHH